MESGRGFAGKMFIDATYEGDLMAEAGVSYHVGREANAVYGETLNGVQVAHAMQPSVHQERRSLREAGRSRRAACCPASTDGPRRGGQRRPAVQAYNFRMCTTDVPENRRAWEKPADYDERWFELLAAQLRGRRRAHPVGTHAWMPNRKTDTNNNFAISTDFIGRTTTTPMPTTRRARGSGRRTRTSRRA